MNINLIEKEWETVKHRLQEIFDDLDVYDLENFTSNFNEGVDYLIHTYDESYKTILNKISPLFPDEDTRKIIADYADEKFLLYP